MKKELNMMGVKGANPGDIKRVLKVAWLPVKVDGGKVIWLCTYIETYKFSKQFSVDWVRTKMHLIEYWDWVKISTHKTNINPSSFLRKTRKFLNL